MSRTVVCVGAVVRRSDEILLVRQSAGHSLEGRWTIPWGRLGEGESPTLAAIRETEEESGVTAEVEGLLGVQELPEPWMGMIGMIFICRHVDGEPTPDNRETDAARYFNRGALEECSENLDPLSYWLVGRVFDNRHVLIKPDESNPFCPCAGYF
jgi:ADP-ribose pyrophosphatase YjhB (NUDIX family)